MLDNQIRLCIDICFRNDDTVLTIDVANSIIFQRLNNVSR